MLFYQFFAHNLHTNYIKKRKLLNTFNNLRVFSSPKIFHYPKLKLSLSIPPKIQKKALNNRGNIQYRSIFSWSKPTIFVKNVRALFTYYYFLKNNKKSLSTILTKLKKFKSPVILSFFMKTVGYILSVFFKSISPEVSKLITLNLKKVRGNWYQIRTNSVIQFTWNSNFMGKSFRKHTWQNRAIISLDSSYVNLTRDNLSGVVDYRTNSLFLVKAKQFSKDSLNFLNLNTTSIYNWKITI